MKPSLQPSNFLECNIVGFLFGFLTKIQSLLSLNTTDSYILPEHKCIFKHLRATTIHHILTKLLGCCVHWNPIIVKVNQIWQFEALRKQHCHRIKIQHSIDKHIDYNVFPHTRLRENCQCALHIVWFWNAHDFMILELFFKFYWLIVL